MKRTLLAVLLLTLCVPALSAQTADEAPFDLELSAVDLPQMEAPLTPVPKEMDTPGNPWEGGSCFSACREPLQSELCTPPLVPQYTVTGTVTHAYFVHFECAASCTGPVVTLVGFAIGC